MRIICLFLSVALIASGFVFSIQPVAAQSTCTIVSGGNSFVFSRSFVNGDVTFTCDNGVIVGPTGDRFNPGDSIPASGIRQTTQSQTQTQPTQQTQTQPTQLPVPAGFSEEDCVRTGTGTEQRIDCERSSSSSSGGSSGGGAVAALALLGLGYWYWGGDDEEENPVSFKPMGSDGIYNQNRQWIGVEHSLSEQVQVSLGSFWFVDEDVRSLLPSNDNIGSEMKLVLGTPEEREGRLSLVASFFVNDLSAGADEATKALLDDSQDTWDERITLSWDKAF